jgi:hypothetical protein
MALLLPHVAEAYVRISRENPVDPIDFMAELLHTRGIELETAAREAARHAFHCALDEANAREQRLLKEREDCR